MVFAGAGRPHGYEAHALTVEHHLDVVAAADPLDVFVAVALQTNGDVIVGVLGEGVLHDHAAVRAEGLIFELLLLGQIGRQRLEVAAGRFADYTERQRADALRSLQVAFE